ncbi:hypothetical protein C2M05_02455 [Serratia marcescens]|nr:hypothetical protein C2M05_02455 [Serratia marcescens]
MFVRLSEAISQRGKSSRGCHTYVVLEVLTFKRLATQCKTGQRHMPQPNTGEYRVLTSQPAVNILGTDTLQMPFGKISRDLYLGFENCYIITIFNDQQISCYPIDYIFCTRQERRCLVELEA